MFAAITLVATIAFTSPLVSARVMQETIRVHNCEEPRWNVDGPKYFGGLGWLDATWLTFKRKDFPRYMSEATPQQQAWAMARFGQKYGWPDQRPGSNHCTGGY